MVPILPSGPDPGRPSLTEIKIQGGSYPERVTITQPVTLTADGGDAIIGGDLVTYTVHVQVPAEPSNGWTDGAVTVTVFGESGSFSCSFSGGEDPGEGFTNPDVRRCLKQTSTDIGTIQSVRLSNPGHEGYFDCIYVDSSTTGRYYIPVDAWVSPDVTRTVAAHWE